MIFGTDFRSRNRHSVFRSGLLLFIGLFFSCFVSAQDTKTVKTNSGPGIVVSTYKEIPSPTEQCTPAECEWWNRLRQAANNLLQKGDQKSKASYISLFVEGIEKSYKIPVKDRSAQTLFYGPPVQTTSLAPTERNGTVKLSVELRSDSSIGDVSILKSLGSEIDRRCVRAVQSIIFLPAIKDGKFVTELQTPEYKFMHAAWAR